MDYFRFYMFKYPEVQPVSPGQLQLLEWTDKPRIPISEVMFEVCPGYDQPKGLFDYDDEVNIYPRSDPGPQKAPYNWVYPDLTCIDTKFTPDCLARHGYSLLCETGDAREAWSELIKQGYEPAPSCKIPTPLRS